MRRQKTFWNTLLLLKDMVFKNLLFRRKHGLCKRKESYPLLSPCITKQTVLSLKDGLYRVMISILEKQNLLIYFLNW